MSVSAKARFLKAPATSNRILILKTVIIHSAVLRWEGYVAYMEETRNAKMFRLVSPN
jgi:hypothetical protein